MFNPTLTEIPHQNQSEVEPTGILNALMSLLAKEKRIPFISRVFPALNQRLSKSRRYRIVIYSHDTMGIEYTRQNVQIAQILANSSLQVDVLIISGIWEASTLPLPPNVDFLTLPAIDQTSDGCFQARSLNISLLDITELRSEIIQVAIVGFDPDLLIVDKAPLGAIGELSATLKYLKTQEHSHCALWLHDALEEPTTLEQIWEFPAHENAIREYYDAIWIHGDCVDHSNIHSYYWAHEVTAKTRYIGNLDQPSWSIDASVNSLDTLSKQVPMSAL
ncbi:MAG: hypothetical protein QNJ46_13045 [Leptolyngbyaceae cyanobacterium MO_188.B28]|nr:hypothetical protein [Leptolyngbyaceae cyanobacterium MO_188.B28]